MGVRKYISTSRPRQANVGTLTSIHIASNTQDTKLPGQANSRAAVFESVKLMEDTEFSGTLDPRLKHRPKEYRCWNLGSGDSTKLEERSQKCLVEALTID